MREIETVVVDSIESLIEEMVPRLGFQRMPIYRGQASADWSLKPRLYRENLGKSEYKSWAEFEAAFLLSLKRRGAAEIRYEPVSELEWMAIGAHNGLPTRLTSWTENALVALFFATDPEPEDADGVVWRLMPGEASFTIAHDFESVPGRPSLYHVQQPDPSMRGQRACFLVHPLSEGDSAPQSFEDRYLSGQERLVLTKLIIPAGWKSYLRRRLAVMGIDRQALFPGLASLCLDLRDEVCQHTDSYEWIFPK